MTMFPVNINTSSTGHKLQGRSKDIVIVSSWPKLKNNICFRNWEYVVLSRVRTLKGLFLIHPIDMEQTFKPTDELVPFMKLPNTWKVPYFKRDKTQRDTENLRKKIHDSDIFRSCSSGHSPEQRQCHITAFLI